MSNFFKGVQILATGHYLPATVIDNDSFTKVVDTSDEWISTRTGIKKRHFSNGEPTWHMSTIAAKNAIAMAGIDPLSIDLILVTTLTQDYATPTLSCILQSKLEAYNATCLDLHTTCAGFIFALDAARRYLQFPDVNTVLIVSVERLSQVTDFTDRSTCVLFGDGAGACIVTAGDEDSMFASHLLTDSSMASTITSKNEVKNSPFGESIPEEQFELFPGVKYSALSMDGREVYKFATKTMVECIEHACTNAGIIPSELAYIIPHQANARIVDTAIKHLELTSNTKVAITIENIGNTSSASIPIALDIINRNGELNRGDRIALVGFGGGLTSGAVVLEW